MGFIGLVTSWASWRLCGAKPTFEASSPAEGPELFGTSLSRAGHSKFGDFSARLFLLHPWKTADWELTFSLLSESLNTALSCTSALAFGLGVVSDEFPLTGSDLSLERPDLSSAEPQLFENLGFPFHFSDFRMLSTILRIA